MIHCIHVHNSGLVLENIHDYVISCDAALHVAFSQIIKGTWGHITHVHQDDLCNASSFSGSHDHLYLFGDVHWTMYMPCILCMSC